MGMFRPKRQPTELPPHHCAPIGDWMFECECGAMPMRVTDINGTEVMCQECERTTGLYVEPKDAWSAWKAGEVKERPAE